jgi:sugar lactone lactonase YvrE
MNDAACDPQGRLWAGALADDHHAGGGALYRIDRDGRTATVLTGLTIPNGLGWSPDGETMYLVDSGPGFVRAFDFDAERGTISSGRTLIAIPPEVGAPDGMTVDAEGDLWVAVYGGGRVHRYTAGGELSEVLDVPAAQTTSCAFGGRGLDRLYITTATENWTVDMRRAEPGAGLVYRIDPDATGRPAAPFVPDGDWWRQAMGRPLIADDERSRG